MIRFRWKAAVIAAAAAVMCIGGTAYAAGHATSWVSHSSPLDESRDFSDLSKLEKKAGYGVSVLESFSNGYEFEAMLLSHDSAVDDEGNSLKKWDSINLRYANGSDEVWLNTEPADTVSEAGFGTEERQPTDAVTIDGIEVKYNRDEYLFLPPNYEEEGLREEFAEDFARQETDDHFYISYGSEKAERSVFQSVRFEKEGISYLLNSMRGSADKDTLLQMAKELIEGK